MLVRFPLFAVSVYGTNSRYCIREEFWLIVVTEGNADGSKHGLAFA